MRKLYKLLMFTFLIILFTECKDEKAIKNIDKPTKNENEISNNILRQDSIKIETIKKNTDSTKLEIDKKDNSKIRILVIECSNNYGMEYDFNKTIFNELKKNKNFELIPFSYKKLMNVNYHGVYDKKYAKPIMEKVNADIFVMTKFISNNYLQERNAKIYWGYETKILNTKTLKQQISIRKTDLDNKNEIDIDIIKNIEKLIEDILIMEKE